MQIAYITKNSSIKNAIVAHFGLKSLASEANKLEIYHSKDVVLLFWSEQDLQLYARRTIEDTVFDAVIIPIDTIVKINPERWIGDIVTPVVVYRWDNTLIASEWDPDERDSHLQADTTLFFEHINPISDFSYGKFGYSFGWSVVDLATLPDENSYDRIDLLYSVDGYSLGSFDLLKTLSKNKDMREALYPLFIVVSAYDNEAETEQWILNTFEISKFLHTELLADSEDKLEIVI